MYPGPGSLKPIPQSNSHFGKIFDVGFQGAADEVRESQNPSKSTGSTIAAIVRLDVSKVELFGGRVQRKRLVAVFPSSDGPILSGSLCFRYCL